MYALRVPFAFSSQREFSSLGELCGGDFWNNQGIYLLKDYYFNVTFRGLPGDEGVHISLVNRIRSELCHLNVNYIARLVIPCQRLELLHSAGVYVFIIRIDNRRRYIVIRIRCQVINFYYRCVWLKWEIIRVVNRKGNKEWNKEWNLCHIISPGIKV